MINGRQHWKNGRWTDGSGGGAIPFTLHHGLMSYCWGFIHNISFGVIQYGTMHSNALQVLAQFYEKIILLSIRVGRCLRYCIVRYTYIEACDENINALRLHVPYPIPI